VDIGALIALLSILLGAGMLAAGFAGAWLLGRAQGERLARERESDARESRARLERVERLVDGFSVELERVADQQRFIAKRLAEPMAPRIESK
jgi:hypothetical protein